MDVQGDEEYALIVEKNSGIRKNLAFGLSVSSSVTIIIRELHRLQTSFVSK